MRCTLCSGSGIPAGGAVTDQLCTAAMRVCILRGPLHTIGQQGQAQQQQPSSAHLLDRAAQLVHIAGPAQASVSPQARRAEPARHVRRLHSEHWPQGAPQRLQEDLDELARHAGVGPVPHEARAPCLQARVRQRVPLLQQCQRAQQWPDLGEADQRLQAALEQGATGLLQLAEGGHKGAVDLLRRPTSARLGCGCTRASRLARTCLLLLLVKGQLGALVRQQPQQVAPAEGDRGAHVLHPPHPMTSCLPGRPRSRPVQPLPCPCAAGTSSAAARAAAWPPPLRRACPAPRPPAARRPPAPHKPRAAVLAEPSRGHHCCWRKGHLEQLGEAVLGDAGCLQPLGQGAGLLGRSRHLPGRSASGRPASRMVPTPGPAVCAPCRGCLGPACPPQLSAGSERLSSCSSRSSAHSNPVRELLAGRAPLTCGAVRSVLLWSWCGQAGRHRDRPGAAGVRLQGCGTRGGGSPGSPMQAPLVSHPVQLHLRESGGEQLLDSGSDDQDAPGQARERARPQLSHSTTRSEASHLQVGPQPPPAGPDGATRLCRRLQAGSRSAGCPPPPPLRVAASHVWARASCRRSATPHQVLQRGRASRGASCHRVREASHVPSQLLSVTWC